MRGTGMREDDPESKTGLVGRVRLRLCGEGGDAAAHAYGAEDEVGEGADQSGESLSAGIM